MSPATLAQPGLTPNKSTGPRTEEGKQRSSMNALRHGLTGRVIVLPSEDLDAYQAFSKELLASLAPETPVEKQFAQTFVDTQWRLNRIRSIEDGMLTLGHFEEAGEIEVNHPQAHAALTSARVFRDDSKAFTNLALYESRLQRTQTNALRQLQALQAERKAQRQAALDAEVALRNTSRMNNKPYDPATEPAHSQFVFSAPEIEAEARRQHRLADAKKAQATNYNLDSYRRLAA